MYNRVFCSIDAEEEQARTEGPEKSLLEGGANEVKADEVADFSQKEARPGSDGADKLNGNHHVIEKGLHRILTSLL